MTLLLVFCPLFGRSDTLWKCEKKMSRRRSCIRVKIARVTCLDRHQSIRIFFFSKSFHFFIHLNTFYLTLFFPSFDVWVIPHFTFLTRDNLSCCLHESPPTTATTTMIRQALSKHQDRWGGSWQHLQGRKWLQKTFRRKLSSRRKPQR